LKQNLHRPSRRCNIGPETSTETVQMMRIRPLLAALPLLLPLAVRAQEPRIHLRAENPLPVDRADETLALPWSAVQRALPNVRPNGVRVMDAGSGAELPVQPLDADGDGAVDSLLFQASFRPSETRRFAVEPRAPAQAPSRAHVRHDSARDDVAWETDRVAFRTYGQGLWRLENTHSSGVDVWVKRTRALVVDRWYAPDHASYHADTGEGADFYSVGPTLGAGGTGVWADGRLHRSENFRRHRVLADGPIRIVFLLEYDPFDAAGTRVTETRRVSMDAGSSLFRIESVFRFDGGVALSFATGTVKRPDLVGTMRRDSAWSGFGTWGPLDPRTGGHGELGTAVLLPAALQPSLRETADHFLALAPLRAGEPVVYYAGAGWTASGDFPTPQSWWAYLGAAAQRLSVPIRLTIE
jgi:pectinesterase